MKGSDALILYHYPCTDGGFAAYAAYRAREQEHWSRVTFMPYDYRAGHPKVSELPSGDRLYLLDCMGPSPEWVRECCARYKAVIVIDHHKTAFEVLDQVASNGGGTPSNLHTCMSEKRSGCTLALDYFHDMPLDLQRLYAYVEDNDIWRHALPDSKAFTAGLSMRGIDYDFREPRLAETVRVIEALKFDDIMESGRADLKRRSQLCDVYFRQARVVTLGGNHEILGVRIASSDWAITSELGERLALASGAHIGAVFNDGKVSLRSIDKVDTTLISKQYGGGGHAGASGFKFTVEQWESAHFPK